MKINKYKEKAPARKRSAEMAQKPGHTRSRADLISIAMKISE